MSTVLKINLEEDAEFRQYIKDMISGQVRAILREQMAGIISTELMKLRLTDPNSPSLNQMIEKAVKGCIDEVKPTKTQLLELARKELEKGAAPVIRELGATVMVDVLDKITEKNRKMLADRYPVPEKT